MRGDDVQAEIDDLTAELRERVVEGLMREAGIQLAWRPAVKPWRHHRSLSDVECGELRHIRYYVGIDAGLTPVDRRLNVRVRALDLKEGRWVSGFGMAWRGRPDQRRLEALDRLEKDRVPQGAAAASLRGGAAGSAGGLPGEQLELPLQAAGGG